MGNNQGDIKDRYLYMLRQIMPIDTYNNFLDETRNMDDSEFISVILNGMEKNGIPIASNPSSLSLKDYLNSIKQIQKNTGIPRENLAAYYDPIRPLEDSINAEYLKKISGSFVSDKIKITSKEDSFFMDLWEHNLDRNKLYIPSDLFFAKTIPLLDCEISVSDENGIVKYRVVVFDDYAELIEKSQENPVCVGAVIPMHPFNINIFLPIIVLKGVDCILSGRAGYMDEKSRDCISNITKGKDAELRVCLLETWYGIQIALLHPNIKEVFLNPSFIRRGELQRRKRKEKRHVKYVKKHILNIDDLLRSTEKAKRQKNCLAWYVIGHWRHYKDGKKIFVKPYWKGALRELKGNAGEDARERDIDFPLDNFGE